MRTMDKKLKAVRKRLLTDFPFYSKASLKIRTKTGEIAPLKLNPAQKILQDAVDKQMKTEGKVSKSSAKTKEVRSSKKVAAVKKRTRS